MIIRNPQFLWLLLLLPTFILIWRWQGMRVVATALLLRLLTVALLIFALTNPTLGSEPPPSGPLVVLVDQSDSLTEQGQQSLRAEALRLAEQAGGEARVLFFGGNVVALPSADPSATPVSVQPTPDTRASDLAGALASARALLPGGGRILLLSDGQQTSGDALAEARLAASSGITIDVMPSAEVQLAEVAITSLVVPANLRTGEAFPIEIGVRYLPGSETGSSLPSRLRLWADNALLGDEEVTLIPGDDSFTFRHQASEAGVLRLRAELTPSGADTFAANNEAAATALVAPPPQVLIVANRTEEAATLVDALEREGVETELLQVANLPSRLSDLAPYDGMVLLDVPAASLSLDQMAGVREFVRSEGRGLVTIGGRNSYTLGAYKDTPLEDVLPVIMEPPPRPQRSDISLLLVVDRSASMTATLGVSKFDMAKEAAILSTESLQSNDRIGILGFDTTPLWVVPFQQIGSGLSLAQIQEQISNLPSGGGTDIEVALGVGLRSLAEQPTEVRHAVLLTDGRSYSNNFSGYQQLVEMARSQNITLSTIAIGEDSDTVLLEQLATWGSGRYYYADEPEDIPRLTLLESEIARADPVVEERLQAQLAQAHPIMRDFVPAELPELDGYVAVTARDSADVILSSPEDDPLLAAWQYGLGRSVAWTPSVGAPWSAAWQSWGGYDRFWGQVVRYTLPEADSGPLQVRMEPLPGGARLTVDAIQGGGEPLNLAVVNARITLPDGSQDDFDVRQSAPGRYTQEIQLPTAGPYHVSVVVLREGVLQQRDIGYVQPVSPEYQLSDAAAPTGLALLNSIAELSGGEMLSSIALPTDASEETPVEPTNTDLWPWLLGLALGIWVLEIAVRRGLFIGRG